MRLPRPDDPTPRKPPLVIFGKKEGQLQRTLSSKRKEPEAEDSSIKRGKVTTETLLRTGSAKSHERSASFRVPDDVFGYAPIATTTSSTKGKGKIEGLSSEQFETLNKTVSGHAMLVLRLRGTLTLFGRFFAIVGGEEICSKVYVEVRDHERQSGV
jgi:hypothetical protein